MLGHLEFRRAACQDEVASFGDKLGTSREAVQGWASVTSGSRTDLETGAGPPKPTRIRVGVDPPTGRPPVRFVVLKLEQLSHGVRLTGAVPGEVISVVAA